MTNPWSAVPVPAACQRIPSMLTMEEKQYLIWLTSAAAAPGGAIVDLGPWLGSSSCALAEGLRRAKSAQQVHSFDLFSWDRGYMEHYLPENLADGADFLPVFRRQTADYADRIVPHRQDLTAFTWSDGPIEILFVDAAKSWELTWAILRGFGGSLVPGRTRVVLQDFRQHEAHWLPLVFDSRPDLWKEIESVDIGQTVTFVPLRPVLEHMGPESQYQDAAFPAARSTALLRARMAKESRTWNQLQFLKTLHRKLLIECEWEQAAEVRAEWLSHPDVKDRHAEDAIAAAMIAAVEPRRGWSALARGRAGEALAIARGLVAGGRRDLDVENLLSAAALQTHDLDEAVAALQRLLKLDPRHVQGRIRLAHALTLKGQHAAAQESVLQTLRMPELDEPACGYGLWVLELAVFASGLQLARRLSVELEPTLGRFAAYWAARGRCDLALGDRGGARACVDRALAIDPVHAPAKELQARLG